MKTNIIKNVYRFMRESSKNLKKEFTLKNFLGSLLETVLLVILIDLCALIFLKTDWIFLLSLDIIIIIGAYIIAYIRTCK